MTDVSLQQSGSDAPDANAEQEALAAIENSQQCGNEQCTCDKMPCRCLQYELHLKVVTRLGGIPIQGITCVRDPENTKVSLGSSGDDGKFQAAELKEKKLVLMLTYANTAEKLRTEKVTVTIDNLIPTCKDKSGLKAEIKHHIEKIRDVLDRPSEDEIDQARTQMDNAKKSLDTADVKTKALQTAYSNAEKKYDDLCEVEDRFSEQTAAELATNTDCDFIDNYSIDITVLEEETADGVTTPKPPASHIAVNSKLSIVAAANDELMKVHLSISLATFSLKVPYMSQLAGRVKLADENVSKDNPDIGVRAWSPVSKSGGAANGASDETTAAAGVNEGAEAAATSPAQTTQATIKESVGRASTASNGYEYNPWDGERLCPPTSSAMIMQYYGLSDVGNIQTRADIMAAHINRQGATADRNGVYYRNPTNQKADCYWEIWGNIAPTWKYIVEKLFPQQTVLNFDADIKYPGNTSNVSKSLEGFLLYLSYGHVLQVRIRGGHMAVLIGAVLDSKAENLWAICHDPYGTLAGPESDYSRIRKESYYEQTGTGSSSRKGRNKAGVGTDDLYEKGRHVYYNDETHTRTQSGGVGAHLQMVQGAYMTYRHPDDATMLTKDFVAGNLLQGDG